MKNYQRLPKTHEDDCFISSLGQKKIGNMILRITQIEDSSRVSGVILPYSGTESYKDTPVDTSNYSPRDPLTQGI